jgi:hypothetical protein
MIALVTVELGTRLHSGGLQWRSTKLAMCCPKGQFRAGPEGAPPGPLRLQQPVSELI